MWTKSAILVVVGALAAAPEAGAQVSDQGFGMTLSYPGLPLRPGSAASVEAVVRNLTGAPLSAARAEIAASGAMDSFSGAGWTCRINLFIGGVPAPTSYICFYSGAAVADGTDFPTISFEVTVPPDGLIPVSGQGVGAFQRLASGVAYLPVTGIASFAQVIPTGFRNRLFSILIDDPVVGLTPRAGSADGTLTAVPGNDVVTTLRLTNESLSVISGLPGLVIAGAPASQPPSPNAPFVPSVPGWACSPISGSLGKTGWPLWECLAPTALTLDPFQAVDVTLELLNPTPAANTVPTEIWGTLEIAPVLTSSSIPVRGIHDLHSLRRPLRAVDDLFVLTPGPTLLDVLGNDPDPAGGGLTVVGAGPTLSGCGAIDTSSGTVDYAPCGVPDEFTYESEDALQRRATATVRVVDVNVSSGVLASLAAVDPSTLPPPPAGVTFPAGIFRFEVAVSPGETVDVAFTLPRPVSAYYKLDNGSWSLFCDASCTNGNTLTLSLTDGGAGDADLQVNGVIVDPGAPAVSALGTSPVAGDDDYTVGHGMTLSIPAPGVLQNDVDAEGDPLVATLASDATHGSLQLRDDGSFTYTPAAGYRGDDSFTYTASDGTSSSNVAMVTLTVTGNQPPVMTNPGDQASAEGAAVSLEIQAEDPDHDSVDFEASGLPEGLGIDRATGVISGSPGYTASAGSPYSVTVFASDATGTTRVSFSWFVANTNRAPSLGNPGDQSSVEGAVVSLALQAEDPDRDPLVFHASGLPPGLVLEATGLISGTLPFTAAGSYAVTVVVTDGASDVVVSFAWTVSDVPPSNRPPDCSQARPSVAVLGSDPDRFVPIHVRQVSDPDGDPVTVTVVRILQDEPTIFGPFFWRWIDGFGISTPLAWVRAERNGTREHPGDGRVYEIRFRAADERGGICEGSVAVAIPWNKDGPAVDDAVRYNSTVPGGQPVR